MNKKEILANLMVILGLLLFINAVFACAAFWTWVLR